MGIENKTVAELIELAAKAAGIQKAMRKGHLQDRQVYSALDYNGMSHTEFDPWNHNGDAFCLAALLDFDVISEGVLPSGEPCVSVLFLLPTSAEPFNIEVLSEAFSKQYGPELTESNKRSAFRRVITKAAAMIGESK